jgi:hypothetical protein
MEDLTNPELESQPEPARSNRTLWLVLGGLVIVLLVAGAFMAGRLINQSSSAAGPLGGSGEKIVISGGPGGGDSTYSIDILPAEELPKTPPEANGIFVRREDNSVFIGTGNISVEITSDGPGSGPLDTNSSYDGPVVEVVIGKETLVYKDVSNEDLEGAPSGDVEIQQKVEEGSIDEIGENSSVQVWGKKTGDRVIAEVIVYSQPMFISIGK